MQSMQPETALAKGVLRVRIRLAWSSVEFVTVEILLMMFYRIFSLPFNYCKFL